MVLPASRRALGYGIIMPVRGADGMNRKQRRAGPKAGQNSAPAKAVEARDSLTLHAMGVEACRAGRLDDAARPIAQAIAADGTMPDFHYNLAIVLKAQGKLRDAAASYARAIALRPDYGDAHNNLGNVWKALGMRDKARACFEAALRAVPGHADSHYNLGILHGEAGEHGPAVRHFRQCLDSDPQDGRGAAILMAHLGAAAAPRQTPPAHLLNLYDVRAQFWDKEAGYFGAALAAQALQAHAARGALDILDIGCGTGLAGVLARPLAARLDGVDLSPAMLEKARSKGVYDRLDRCDFVTTMSERPGRYDAVLAAAALIHHGDLAGIFQATATCLRDNGLFVFTLFLAKAGDFAAASNYRLAQSGCFEHGGDYVRRLAENHGFSVATLEQVIHERDQDGNEISGLVAVLRLS